MIVTKWCVQNYQNQVEGARMVRANIESGYSWLIRDALDLRYAIMLIRLTHTNAETH